MRAAAFAIVLAAAGAAPGQSLTAMREVGDTVFQIGAENRHDAARARQSFATAAAAYDTCYIGWEPKYHSPAIALMRGRAHYLAGELPQAIGAFRDGLELAPWDADLQRGLAHCRAKVAYPTEATPAERMRPDPFGSLRDRVSPTDLLAVIAVSSLLLTVGLARRFTTEDSWSTPIAMAGLVGLLVALTVGVVVDRQNQFERKHPVVLVGADTVLRTGNGPSFPPRVEAALPRGAEVRELGRRGGWVQVELPGGAAGWLPAAVVLSGNADRPGPPSTGVQDLLD